MIFNLDTQFLCRLPFNVLFFYTDLARLFQGKCMGTILQLASICCHAWDCLGLHCIFNCMSCNNCDDSNAWLAWSVCSYMKLVHIFSVNPHLGPLQISLGRMIIDILKFFFIYSLVLFAFGCGEWRRIS